MLKTRLIPSLLLDRGRLVKGVRFGSFKDVGQPVSTAKIYDAQGADELMFLDITASREGRQGLAAALRAVAEFCFMPLTSGGGVRSLDDIRELLLAGADKVSINTAAAERPELITEASRRFGKQCIVVSIDVRETSPGRYEVFTHSGTKAAGLEAVAWARYAAHLGAGEILLNSIDRDGTRAGFDLRLVRAVSEAVPIPVIAAGGVGSLQHLVEGVMEGKASAVSAGTIFYLTDQSVIKARTYMKMAGLNMRLA